ncbi:hypothetical protein ACI4A4_28650, partial [Klebsiella pneumoniae]|uniref:hypothetical protein n=1 Tax=Klebsiella pneumoniae TaxID=573 RepID=UPI0038520449
SIMVDSKSLYEFLTKYFYDANWDVEVKEQFGWTDKQSLSNLAASSGYKLTHFETYTLPYLADKWNGDFEIFKSAKP